MALLLIAGFVSGCSDTSSNNLEEAKEIGKKFLDRYYQNHYGVDGIIEDFGEDSRKVEKLNDDVYLVSITGTAPNKIGEINDYKWELKIKDNGGIKGEWELLNLKKEENFKS